MDDLVSVIITCYNHEQYIEECLESIFKQSYPNIELIVIDDGSTDHSREIIEETLKKSPFKKTEYIYQRNQGVVVARNLGLQTMNGDYCIFVDSDDSLDSEYIVKTIQVAHSQQADIVYTKMLNLETQELVLGAKPFDLIEFFIGNNIHSAALVKKSILLGTRYDMYLNDKLLEDYDFFFNLIVNCNAKAVPCEDTHLNYRILQDSRSNRNNLLKYYNVYLYILKKYWVLHPEYALTALEWHINRLLDMNPNTRTDNQFVKIYFEIDGCLSEENTFVYPIYRKDTISFTVPDNAERIRLDLSEVQSYYKKVILINNETQTELIAENTNGIQIDDAYLFKETDPQIYFNLKKQYSNSYTLQYEMMDLSDVASENYVANFLGKKIVNLQIELLKLRDAYYRLATVEAELKRYKAELQEMVFRYNSVVNSRRWIIPTKIINFFRRNK